MDKAKQATRSGSLNEVSMVLLNKLLSLPFAIFLILIFGEWNYVMNVDLIKLPMFWAVATASGLLGLAISFTSMWFLRQTGPTTYSLVGSLNKIPVWPYLSLVSFCSRFHSVCQTCSAYFLFYLLEYSLPEQKCPEFKNWTLETGIESAKTNASTYI